MNPRKTMGVDPFEESPLDGLVPPPKKKEDKPVQTDPPRESSKKATGTPSKQGGNKPQATKERLTVHLPLEVIERAKNAVFWTPGLTLAGLAEGAFLDALERMEKKNGKPFPKRKADLKGGRPIK